MEFPKLNWSEQVCVLLSKPSSGIQYMLNIITALTVGISGASYAFLCDTDVSVGYAAIIYI
jgi:hypothetical protein